MVDKDKIFFLFDDEEENNKDSELDIVFEEEEEVYMKLRMFCKLISNNSAFQLQLQQFFDKIEKEYDGDSVKNSSDFTTYTRAWFYIKQVDIQREEHIKAITSHNPNQLYKCLKKSIQYFEDKEDYEKCAHLFKIQNITKSLKERKE